MEPQSWGLVWSILCKYEIDEREREDIYEALVDEAHANIVADLRRPGLKWHGPNAGLSDAMQEWLANVGVDCADVATINSVTLEVLDMVALWFERAKKARRQTEVA